MREYVFEVDVAGVALVSVDAESEEDARDRIWQGDGYWDLQEQEPVSKDKMKLVLPR